MLDHQLWRLHAVVVVDRQPVGGADGVSRGVGKVELDGVQSLCAFAQAQLEMLVLEDALAFDDELVLEQRCRKTLAPDFCFEQAGSGDRVVA